jgi:hypothetical protein
MRSGGSGQCGKATNGRQRMTIDEGRRSRDAHGHHIMLCSHNKNQSGVSHGFLNCTALPQYLHNKHMAIRFTSIMITTDWKLPLE